ncbi:MAG: HDIG domain-containing protein [Acidobacteria bacterium]|nr:HDIG domain-containing protein [Acidobacteriota bacterium]
MELSYENSKKILNEWVKSESLLNHAKGVEIAMRAYAKKFGEDEEIWAIVGLLHDLDYEKYPTMEEHPFKAAEYLKSLDFPDFIVKAILSHASYTNVKRETLLEKTLYAVDEIVGFLFACAYVQPEKSFKTVKVKSVLKKMKDKAFARSVNREEIKEGAELLGIPLEEHIEFVLKALAEKEEEIGF